MMRVTNLTYGELEFAGAVVLPKDYRDFQVEEYNKVRKKIEYASEKGWCLVSEVREEKIEKDVEKKKKEETK